MKEQDERIKKTTPNQHQNMKKKKLCLAKMTRIRLRHGLEDTDTDLGIAFVWTQRFQGFS